MRKDQFISTLWSGPSANNLSWAGFTFYWGYGHGRKAGIAPYKLSTLGIKAIGNI